MIKESLKRYTEYWNSDNEFNFCIRMTFEWNEDKYFEMLELIRSVIHDYKDEDRMPELITYFFEKEMVYIIGTISNPLFVNKAIYPSGYTEEQYKKLIKQRIADLKKMQIYFMNKDFEKI